MSARRLIIVGIALVALVSGHVTAVCAEERTGPAAAGRKAIRGLANSGLGIVAELPKTIYYDTLEDGPLYGLTIGILEGLSWGIARSLIGIYEVVTFPLPIPTGYHPILRPEYPVEAGKTDLFE